VTTAAAIAVALLTVAGVLALAMALAAYVAARSMGDR
jgi:hypothetical protein